MRLHSLISFSCESILSLSVGRLKCLGLAVFKLLVRSPLFKPFFVGVGVTVNEDLWKEKKISTGIIWHLFYFVWNWFSLSFNLVYIVKMATMRKGEKVGKSWSVFLYALSSRPRRRWWDDRTRKRWFLWHATNYFSLLDESHYIGLVAFFDRWRLNTWFNSTRDLNLFHVLIIWKLVF